MSQSDFGVIDPNTKSGTQLAVDLNGFRDAVNSGHSGAARPAYLPAGGHWVRVVSSTQWDLVLYDGSVDYTLRSVNPTTGQKIGIPAADLADKQTSANDNTTGRLLVNPAYGLGTTGALSLPSGTTANRPASPSKFDSRGNSTTGAPEWWSGSAWVPFSGTDYLNTTRIDVESATTVDLTTAAPATSQLAISGTGVSINGFTVAADRFFVVKMTGASNTLVNSASLITGRGANIPVVAGDSFLMRSTAVNTVEVICGEFLIDRAIGSGQTLQNVAASRAITTNYTNTTGRTIFVSIGMVGYNTPSFDLMVDSLVASFSQYQGGPVSLPTIQAPIPNGSGYSVQLRGGTFSSIRSWLEIR